MAKLFKAAVFWVFLVVVFVASVKLMVRMKRRTKPTSNLLEDSLSGNFTRYRVLQSKEETGGEAFSVEMLMHPHAWGAYPGKSGAQKAHLHPEQQETIAVVAGRLGYWRGHAGAEAELGPGQEVVFQPGEAHCLWNAAPSSSLVVRLTARPAGRCGEALYETLAGLGRQYGSPLAVSPTQLLLTQARCGVVLTDMGANNWEMVETMLVPLAETLGYTATYPAYKAPPPPASWREEGQGSGEAQGGGGGGAGGGDEGGADGGNEEGEQVDGEEGGQGGDGGWGGGEAGGEAAEEGDGGGYEEEEVGGGEEEEHDYGEGSRDEL